MKSRHIDAIASCIGAARVVSAQHELCRRSTRQGGMKSRHIDAIPSCIGAKKAVSAQQELCRSFSRRVGMKSIHIRAIRAISAPHARRLARIILLPRLT